MMDTCQYDNDSYDSDEVHVSFWYALALEIKGNCCFNFKLGEIERTMKLDLGEILS